MNWLSVIILAIIVLAIFEGMKRGMVRTAFSLISVILTLFLSGILNPYMSEVLMEKTPVYNMIQKKCEEEISFKLENTDEEELLIKNLPLPESMKNVLLKNNTEESYQHLLAETFGEYLSHSIARVTIGSISLICTFVLVNLFMNLLLRILDRIFSLPVLSLLNRVGGGVFGAIQGVFFVWVIFLIITLFWDTTWAQEAIDLVKQNEITSCIYENNLLLYFMSTILK